MVDCGSLDRNETGWIPPNLGPLFDLIGDGYTFDGILLTHCHMDHINGLGYLFNELESHKITVPTIYGTDFTLGIAKRQQNIHSCDIFNWQVIKPGEILTLGDARVLPFEVFHSAPVSVGFAIKVAKKVAVFTGDFKAWQNDVRHDMTTFKKWLDDIRAKFGKVDVLVADTTRADQTGFSNMESAIEADLQHLIASTKHRLIITMFGSNANRLAKIIAWTRQAGKTIGYVGQLLATLLRLRVSAVGPI